MAWVYAVMAHLYGYKRWEVDALTDEEVGMYLSQAGAIRAMRDLPVNRAAFSQIDADGRAAMLRPSGPDDVGTRAWEAYLAVYRAQVTPKVTPLDIHPSVAEAIAAFVEAGHLNWSADSARVWREDVLPLWPRILATLPAA